MPLSTKASIHETPVPMSNQSLVGGVAGKPLSKTGVGGKFNN